MECPCRWATIYILAYLALNNVKASCQNSPLGRMSPEISLQPQIGDSPSKAQLVNMLLSLASINGILSDGAPVCPSTLPQEQPQATKTQNVPQTLNVVPLLPQIPTNCEKKPIVVNGSPTVATSPLPNLVLSPASSFPTSMVLQPMLKTEPVSWTFSHRTPQVSSEHYTQPSHAVWQMPQPVTAINSCSPVQPAVLAKTTPHVNLQLSPPCSTLPAINIESGIAESVIGSNFVTMSEVPNIGTSDCKTGIPLHLQINIPAPSDPVPRITIISAAQPSGAPTNSIPTSPPFGIPPPPPIIMRRSRSSLRSLLPMLLLAMFNDRGCCGGYGSPCNCNCDSDEPILIPYPIPIPINNPIINIRGKSPFSSRDYESRDNGN